MNSGEFGHLISQDLFAVQSLGFFYSNFESWGKHV